MAVAKWLSASFEMTSQNVADIATAGVGLPNKRISKYLLSLYLIKQFVNSLEAICCPVVLYNSPLLKAKFTSSAVPLHFVFFIMLFLCV